VFSKGQGSHQIQASKNNSWPQTPVEGKNDECCFEPMALDQMRRQEGEEPQARSH